MTLISLASPRTSQFGTFGSSSGRSTATCGPLGRTVLSAGVGHLQELDMLLRGRSSSFTPTLNTTPKLIVQSSTKVFGPSQPDLTLIAPSLSHSFSQVVPNHSLQLPGRSLRGRLRQPGTMSVVVRIGVAGPKLSSTVRSSHALGKACRHRSHTVPLLSTELPKWM